MDNFEKIYHLAKQKDKRALSELVALGVCVDVHQGIRNATTPIMRLAKENDQDSVYFLIDGFNASLNNALMGALQSGDQDFIRNLKDRGANTVRSTSDPFFLNTLSVNELTSDTEEAVQKLLNFYLIDYKFHSIDKLLRLSAEAGYQKVCHSPLGAYSDNVSVLKYFGITVVGGAARAGHVSWVLRLLTDQARFHHDFNFCFLQAVRNAALGAQAQLLNLLISYQFQFSTDYSRKQRKAMTLCEASVMYQYIAEGAYDYSPWLSSENGQSLSGKKNALRILVFIENTKAREGVANAIYGYRGHFVHSKTVFKEAKNLLNKANKIRHSMQEKNLSYDDAFLSLSLLTPEVLELVDYDFDTHRLHPDVTSIIAGYLTETPESLAYKVINAEYLYKQKLESKEKELLEQKRQTPLIEKWREKRAHNNQREAGIEMNSMSFWRVNKKNFASEAETNTTNILSDANPPHINRCQR